MYPADLKYSKEHEWVKVEGTKARVGVTHHAQSQLGDIVFVDPPKPGAVVKAMGTVGVVESVKAVSDVYSPISGSVTEANGALEAHPELVNKDCYGQGWIFVVEMADPKELDALMDVAAYQAYLESEGAH
jgi:glycine cleavage system H protein